uniref:regulator of G-protein signaling 17-like n=2 Tax=Myxine glutinosa TaxID=7769 RepID=UPI00358F1294
MGYPRTPSLVNPSRSGRKPVRSDRVSMSRGVEGGGRRLAPSMTPPASPAQAQPSAAPPRDSCCFCCLNVRVRQQDSHARPSMTDLALVSPSRHGQLPPSEDVLSWAHSFDRMIFSPTGRALFQRYLRSEFSEENLLFWLACEELQGESEPSTVQEKARLIYEDFISILSPREVSLDSRVRESIHAAMANPSAHMYHEAQLQIYTLMHRDSFPRFLASPMYRQCVSSASASAVPTASALSPTSLAS